MLRWNRYYMGVAGKAGGGKKRRMLFFKKNEGSYTVEAAFVVPVVLGLVFVIFYTMFLLHDKVMLQANLDNMLFLLAEGEEIEKKDYESYLNQGLWFTTLQEAKIKENAVLVSGKIKIEANIDIPVLSYFVNGKQKIEISEAYSKIQPEMIIRYGADTWRKKQSKSDKENTENILFTEGMQIWKK